MPSAMTHAYFAEDVYRKLPPRVKQKIERDTMRVFAQGPDVFYAHFFSKKTRLFGREMHVHKTKRFFENYIEYMKRYRLFVKLKLKSTVLITLPKMLGLQCLIHSRRF